MWATHWWMPVLFIVIAGHLTNVCVTLFLHRAQTHRGVRSHASPRSRCASGSGSPRPSSRKEWVACHRKHHAFADREGDPHSARSIEGLRNIVLKGAFYYRKAVRQPGMLEKYGKGTPNDWIERHLLTPLNWLGILLMLAIDIYLFGFFVGPLVWGVADDLDSVLGRRHHQRRRPRARLSQLRREGREPEHLADRHLARRRGAAQQPSRRSALARSSRRSGSSSTSAGSTSASSSLLRPRKIEYARAHARRSRDRRTLARSAVASALAARGQMPADSHLRPLRPDARRIRASAVSRRHRRPRRRRRSARTAGATGSSSRPC